MNVKTLQITSNYDVSLNLSIFFQIRDLLGLAGCHISFLSKRKILMSYF